jgi:magnesium-transporting ATPase (P-type)
MVFTCFPISWYGIYDKEHSYDNILDIENKFYIQGMNDLLFHKGRFWKWIVYGSFQSVIMFAYSYYANESATNLNGYTLDLIGQGSIAYSSVVIITNIKIFLGTSTHTLFSIVLFAASILSYYICLIFMSYFIRFENFNNLYMLFTSADFYLSSILMIIMCVLFDEGSGKLLKLFGILGDPSQKVTQSLKIEDINVSSASAKKEIIGNHLII